MTMKTSRLATTIFLGALAAASGQGSLTPPGASPAPTMKTLQEIWDKLEDLDARVTRIEGEQTEEAAIMSDAITGLGEALGATTRYIWNLSTIDASSDDVGNFASLAFNAGGDPAVAYYNATDGDLWFIEHNGSTWKKEMLDSSGDVGRFCSLAFSKDGHAGIAYHDGAGESLNFTCRYEGNAAFLAYMVKSPDASQIWGFYNSLAFAPNGRPYIAHRDQDALKVYISYLDAAVTGTPGEFASANWNTFSLMADWSGFRSSLAFKSSGKWGLTHGLPGSAYSLQYVDEVSSGLSFSPVDSAAHSGYYSSLKFDSADKAGVAYHDQASGTLKYAARSGSGWNTVTVDSSTGVGKWCSLAFTSDDRPVIAYYDETNKDLKYAERNADGSWKLSTIDATGDVGEYASLAIGRMGRPSIAYYDASNGDLKFAEATARIFVPTAPQIPGIGGN